MWRYACHVMFRLVLDLTVLYVIILFTCLPKLYRAYAGLNVDDLKKRTLKYFGPGSEYDTPVNDPYREKGGKKTKIK